MHKPIAYGVLAGAIFVEQIHGRGKDHIETENKPPEPRHVFSINLAAVTTAPTETVVINTGPHVYGVTE